MQTLSLDEVKVLFSGKEFNPLPNDKILDWSNLEAFADDKVSATQKQKFFLGWVENIAGKGENAGYQLVTSIFSFSHKVLKGCLCRVVKIRDCVVKS